MVTFHGYQTSPAAKMMTRNCAQRSSFEGRWVGLIEAGGRAAENRHAPEQGTHQLIQFGIGDHMRRLLVFK
jgi:hypothetical protein